MPDEYQRLVEILIRIEQVLADNPTAFGANESGSIKNQLVKVRSTYGQSKGRYAAVLRLHNLLKDLWVAVDQDGLRGYTYQIGRLRADLSQYMISLADVARVENETAREAYNRLSWAYHDQEAELGAYFARHLAASDTRT